jgi:hypothetical protein
VSNHANEDNKDYPNVWRRQQRVLLKNIHRQCPTWIFYFTFVIM